MEYRFPSLFAVDTFSKYWTANYEFASKKTNVRLKLKDWFFEKGSFGTANNEGRMYLNLNRNFIFLYGIVFKVMS